MNCKTARRSFRELRTGPGPAGELSCVAGMAWVWSGGAGERGLPAERERFRRRVDVVRFTSMGGRYHGAKSMELLFSAHINHAVAQRGGGPDFFAQLIAGQNLQFIRIRREAGDHAIV
jgi:hypothetical protein